MKRPTRRRRRRPGQTWRLLAASGESELGATDIAVMNLVCALGLPGAESLDMTASLEKLKNWARHVKREIRRNGHRFQKDGKRNGYSRSQWQVAMMVTVLQQDCGVRYNPQRIYEPDFTDSRDQFLHGILLGDGGTCASMPVLYVAAGRRLGFPLKLVSAKAHLFARWESDGERFNIEASGCGISFYPDEHYHRWPIPLTRRELAQGKYLRSMNGKDQLAAFLAARGHCLHDNMRFDEASKAYAAAARLSPSAPHYRNFHLLAEACAGRPVSARFAREAERDLVRIVSALRKGEESCIMPS